MKLFYRLIIQSFLMCICVSCAKKGRPSGGPKDEIPPVLVTANPPYESTNFKKKKIKIYFNEYIVLKDLNKQLIVSPPMKNPPVITPQGTPSKYIQIKLLDTLRPNTTYTFNFGNAVQDNNEYNKLEQFKYVFSTGDAIDSLTLAGSVRDAFEIKNNKNVSLLLYKIDSTYNDSIVFKRKPDYVTSTLDSINYQFTNIQEGRYALLALEEPTPDYIYNPKTDKIGFLSDTLVLPKDSVVKTPISLFKEIEPYVFKRVREVSKGKIQFGFTGKQTNMKVLLQSTVPSSYQSFHQFEKEKDTLNYWFTGVEADSLNFIISNNSKNVDTVTVKLRKKRIDSLQISSTVKRTLNLRDTVFLVSNNPITTINKDKFVLIDKDSAKIDDVTIEQKQLRKVAVLFKKEPKNRYHLNLLPDALIDLYGKANDSLSYSFSTKQPEDYGTISLAVENKTAYPVIIELLENDAVIRTARTTTSKTIKFDLLEIKNYTIRAIIDENKNNIWDTGNYLNKQQPERIVYFDKKIPLRANWVVNEPFVIK